MLCKTYKQHTTSKQYLCYLWKTELEMWKGEADRNPLYFYRIVPFF